MVNGLPHATEDDHEQVQQEQDIPQEGLSLAEQEELGLLGDPISSSDEKQSNPKPKANDEDALRKPPPRKRKAESPLPPREPELRDPRKKKTRNAAPIVPKAGSFKQNQAAKAGVEGNKEDTNGSQTPPNSSGNIWLERFKWSSSQGSQTSKKIDYSSRKTSSQPTSNIHAAPSPAKNRNSRPTTFSTKSKKKVAEPEHNSDSSEISMEDADEVNRLGAELAAEQEAEERRMAELGLRNVPGKKKRPVQTNGNTSEMSVMNEAELEAELGKQTLREQLGLTDSQASSLPPSSAPQEDMDHIDDYVRELPAEAEEGTACPICNEPVDQDYYWSFWKGLDKTVKNQAAFCHTHRKATAQKEYLAEGYPSVDGIPRIDWSAIPERIKKHRMALYSILTNETPSAHRTRYTPLALTGKAAAIPSKRHDLSPSKQRHLDSYALDSNAVYPGYYGPRGRRLITEAVMALLSSEIKRSTDPVVMTSGPATFVQAVLVPEVAVRLIMEDLMCDAESAEEVRERTYEMGTLLHEEIEDRVEVGEEEGGENEYLG